MRFRARWLVVALLGALALPAPVLAQGEGQGDPFAPGNGEEDPFAQSQFEEVPLAGRQAAGGPLLSVQGFVDTGYIHIAQDGPDSLNGSLSWLPGNTQSTFSRETSTFTLNEVDLTLAAERQTGAMVVGGRASVDFLPSRDTAVYGGTAGEGEWDVDQGFVFLHWPQTLNTTVRLGRAPGFVTLEQEESESPDFRGIGHGYVFLAGGGYPYGLQVLTEPGGGFGVKLGVANGGLGAYSLYPGDESTVNRPVARTDDGDDTTPQTQADGRTTYGALTWTPFDQPADLGTLRLGIAAGSNPALTWNPVKERTEAYSFSNGWLAYRWGSYEVRAENARLDAYYEVGLGRLEATMTSLQLSLHGGVAHLVTLRGETMDFVSDRAADEPGTASRQGLSYRYRLAEGAALKLEWAQEVQRPQYWDPAADETLTTTVATTSWVYSF